MNAQSAGVLQGLKAIARNAGHIEVKHKLIDLGLQKRQVPSAAAHAQKVYKCVDANGTTVFSPTPCGPAAKEIDTTAAAHQGGESSDAVRDISLGSQCKNRADAVYAQFGGPLAAVQREINDERDSMRYSRNNLAGATRDNAISRRIAALEGRKTTLMDEQNAALVAADQACAADQEAEAKRRRERDAAIAEQRAKELTAKKTADGTH